MTSDEQRAYNEVLDERDAVMVAKCSLERQLAALKTRYAALCAEMDDAQYGEARK